MYQRVDYHNYSPTLGELVTAGVPVFNEWWDTYVPEHKEELINKILHNYWFNQIGAETPDRFVWYINTQLERIMPYYNQLYQSELIKIDPMLNHAIQSSGRSIENLLKHVNSTDDKFSKSVRDFVGITDTQGINNNRTSGNTSTTKDGTEQSTYQKDGHDNITENETKDVTEDQHTTEAKTGKDTTVTDKDALTVEGGTKTSNTITEETPNEKTVKEMKWGQSETGKIDKNETSTTEGKGSKEWTETKDDDSTTKTVTSETSRDTTSAEQDYADTPQKRLNVTAEDGTSQLRRDYLTNVTWNSGSANGQKNGDQDVTFADDETVTHNENTSDNTSAEGKQTEESTKTKSGIDTETTTKTGSSQTNSTTHDTRDLSTEETGQTTATTSYDSQLRTDTNSSQHTTDTNTINKTWDEKGTANAQNHSTANTINSGTVNGGQSGSEQVHEKADNIQSTIDTQNKETQSTTDTGTTDITKGFMNVSSSALLEAFRKTFLNIDEMIIKELAENFMYVY